MSGTKKRPLGVPSPDEEALQEPAIDPVSLLASAGTGAIANAGESYVLNGSLKDILDTISRGAGEGFEPASRVPALVNAAKGAGKNSYDYLRNLAFNKFFFPSMSNQTQNVASSPKAWNVAEPFKDIASNPYVEHFPLEGESQSLMPEWLQGLALLAMVGGQSYNVFNQNKKKK